MQDKSGQGAMSEAWRSEVTALITEFCWRADSGRHAELVALFAQDGRFIIPDLPLESGKEVVYHGHDQLRQRWGGKVTHATCHIVSLPRLERTSETTASGATNLISYRGALHGMRSAREPFIVGRFDDQYVHVDGRWLIAERRLVVQFAGEALRQGMPVPHTPGA